MNVIYKSAGVVAALLLAPAASATLVIYEAAGANPAAITGTRDAFRDAVGGGNAAGANGSFGGLRREINWDGVPNGFADPNLLPANFFNANSPRGAVFSTPGTGFLVSANGACPLRHSSGSRSTSRLSAPSACLRRSTATSPTSRSFSRGRRSPPRRALSLPSSSMSKWPGPGWSSSIRAILCSCRETSCSGATRD